MSTTTTTDSSYPAAEGRNCIVVNDDDEEDRERHEFSSSSKPASPSSNTSSTLSQNPSNRSTSSSSAASTSNWASLTRMSHHNRFYKQQVYHPSKSHEPPQATRNYYTSAPLASAESPTSGVYKVKSRLASLINDSESSNVAIKIDDGSLFLNNSYV